jgi:glycosyltransferase involved in cell wall biosynthesis
MLSSGSTYGRKNTPPVSEPPLVAVVTPVYNGGHLLGKTLACIQNQSYGNIVHVVLDNASSDVTPDLISACRSGPKKLITRRNPNLLPQIDNWNAAMAMVPPEAKYIKLLTADDLIRTDCIEKMVELAESDPEIDFVHAIDVFNEWTKPHGLEPSSQIYDGKEYGRRWMAGQITWVSGSHMFFRAKPDLLINTFSKEIYPLMDMELIFGRLLSRKMAFIFEPLLFTRYTGASVTSKLGGLSSYITPSYRILLKHGRKFLDEADYKRACRSNYLKVVRHLLLAKVTGHQNGKNISNGLIQEGIEVRLADYLIAVATWPTYKLKSLYSGFQRKRTDPSRYIPESAFASE